MSSISPSRPSSAASGEQREHQSQRRSSSRASSRGSASTAMRAGKRARASGSERPRLKPSRAAAASTQTSLCALSILATATSGARLSTPPSRRARSVARRGSQRERNRLVVNGHVLESHVFENNVLPSPFQTNDPPSIERLRRPFRPRTREARLDEPRPAGEGPRQVRASRSRNCGAGRSGDLKPRLRGGGGGHRL